MKDSDLDLDKEYPGTLKLGEPHPAAFKAKDWISTIPSDKLFTYLESFASLALSGNRLAEICCETLNRLMAGKPVSDRYVLGLAWALRDLYNCND